MTLDLCTDCGVELTTRELEHEASDHPGLCCDCADLRWGMPVEQLNAERAKKGRPPLHHADTGSEEE